MATSMAQRLEGWMHHQVAKRSGGSVLEIGAGTLNHLQYEEAVTYDVVEPFAALYRGSPWLTRVRQIFVDLEEVPVTQIYDRVISIAVLEHLANLPQILARAALHLRSGGLFQHAIPSEGAFAWGLAWRFTTGVAYRLRTGLSYRELMRHEHLNTASEIEACMGFFFKQISIRRFPLTQRHLSLYTYIEARDPCQQRCESFLKQQASSTVLKDGMGQDQAARFGRG